MSLYMNGTNIGTALGNLVFNHINVTMVYCNGVKVWEIKAPAGSQVFTTSGSFTVPTGIYSVQVTVIGAGGSGANGSTNGGGGYAGAVVTQTVSVSPGQVIPVSIGAGGVAREFMNSGGYVNGAAGGNSSFGSVVAAGGSGGFVGGGYGGNGGATPYGTVDGGAFVYAAFVGYGGQGCIGNGGGGGNGLGSAGAGGVGAGGGGVGYALVGTWTGTGGRGQVIVSWN